MTTHHGMRVICHAGYRGEESPRRFSIGQQEVEVSEIIDRWLAPDHRYFKCRGSDGNIYILRHDVIRESWELTLFAGGSGPRNWGPVDEREVH